jgi:cell pole-organizing protein PopZ
MLMRRKQGRDTVGDMSNEPSMEEILSSIKRIIAEDSDAALTAPRGRRAVAGSPAERGPSTAQPVTREPEVLELTEAVPPEEAAADHRNDRQDQPEAPGKPPLVSDAALSASRSAIAALSALVIKPEVTGSDTLEGLVREMLKPMLADWLDQRLPDVVERLVAQEISRITARG